MCETINFKEFKRQAKMETFKRNTIDKAKAFGKWYCDNKEFTIPVTVAVVGFATKGLGKLSHELAMQREVNHRDLMSWDPRLGEWLELKRKLTNTEKAILDARIKNGESKVNILNDLGVLK